MFFDLSNYWIFLAVLAAIYVTITMFLQSNVGGKNRLKTLQAEIRELQKGMTEAAKRKDNIALDEAVSKNWKLTIELLLIQMQMFVVIIGLLFILTAVFPILEPGTSDDIHLAVYDDGLIAHCDKVAKDDIYSTCYTFPENQTHGAWVVDAYLHSESGETMARHGTGIYYDGGEPSDIWIQSSTQGGIIDSLLGKKAYQLNVTTNKENYTVGQTMEMHVQSNPQIPSNAKLEAVLNGGTFLYYDLPFTIPLINIHRIIGSYGLFLFLAFVMSIIYSIGKTVLSGKKPK